MGNAPPILIAVLSALCAKSKGLQQKLIRSWPEYMQDYKWHCHDEQAVKIQYLSNENKEDLHQICATEIKLLQVVYLMISKH